MLEAYLGIIAANMALARYVWIHLLGKSNCDKRTKAHHFRKVREGYDGKNKDLPLAQRRTNRNPALTVDEIPLPESGAGGIRRTTTFRIDEEAFSPDMETWSKPFEPAFFRVSG